MNLYAEKVEASVVRVNLGNDLQECEDKFLKIFNNVREDGDLFAMRNFCSNNSVEVICRKDVEDAVVDWLEYYGEIEEVGEANVIALEDACLYDAIIEG